MRLHNRSMLKMEGLEWPYPEDKQISAENFAVWIDYHLANVPEDLDRLETARIACGFTEAYLNSGAQMVDKATTIKEATAVAESDEIKDHVIDLMVAHPQLTPTEVAEHVFVWRYLRHLLQQPI